MGTRKIPRPVITVITRVDGTTTYTVLDEKANLLFERRGDHPDAGAKSRLFGRKFDKYANLMEAGKVRQAYIMGLVEVKKHFIRQEMMDMDLGDI
jgi:hypothetical protein